MGFSEQNAHRALEKLMQGFLELPANGLGAGDLREVYDNSLCLLYRLLFVVYGEGIGLLPPGGIYSLERPCWERLRAIFRAAGGGRLFDPEVYPFLEEKAIGDRPLLEAIELLSEFGHAPDVRHLGSIYEGLLEYAPRFEAGRVYLEPGRGERKSTGSYYTPRCIVEHVVRETLGPPVEEAAGRGGPEEVLKLRVLDPSMGSGHFLVEAADFLARAIASDPRSGNGDPAHWRSRVAESCLYGVDSSPLAVEIARMSLSLAAFSPGEPLLSLEPHLKCGDSLVGARLADLAWPPPAVLGKKAREQLEQEKAGQMSFFFGEGLPVEGPGLQPGRDRLRAIADLWVSAYFGNEFRPRDYEEAARSRSLPSLPVMRAAGRVSGERRFFHWELEFPEVFGSGEGFDAVIGNPPYVSFGLRGVGKVGRREQEYYRSRFARSAEYKISTYALFMELAISLLREGGRHAFVVPDSFLLGQYFGKVRRFMLDNTAIHEITLIQEDFWASGAVGSSVVYVLSRGALAGDVTVARADTLEDFAKGATLQNSYPREFFEKAHLNRFRLLFTPGEKSLVERLEAVSELRLGDVMGIHTGIRSRVGQKTIQGREKRGESWHRGLVSGTQVVRYGVFWEGDYLDITPRLLWSGGWDEDIVGREKLLIRQTGDRIIAGPDWEGLYHLNNLHAAVMLNENYDIRYVLALLNSRLMFRYYTLTSLELGRALPQTDIEMLLQLPVRRINFAAPAGERRDAAGRAAALYEDDDDGALLDLAAESVSAGWPDAAHDVLAYLAGQMVDLTGGIRGLVGDFREELGAVSVGLTGGRQERTLWKRAGECRPFVDGQGRPVRRLDDALGWSREAFEAFVRELAGGADLPGAIALYDDYGPLYRELANRAARTDWLIDRVVYRLYGLTEDEVALVEAGEKGTK